MPTIDEIDDRMNFESLLEMAKALRTVNLPWQAHYSSDSVRRFNFYSTT